MAFPDPQFDRLASTLPEAPAWAWQALAGTGLLGAAAAVALHHSWIGAGLLVAGCLGAGAGQAIARRTLSPALPILTLGLLALPFGFVLADPARALAAMFLMFAMTVLTVLGRGHVSLVTWLAAGALLLACLFPDRFSLLAYLIGVIAFIAAGQGVAQDVSKKTDWS